MGVQFRVLTTRLAWKMGYLAGWTGWGLALGITGAMSMTLPSAAQSGLTVVYPPDQHETTADRIFLIGTATAEHPVQVNGEIINHRSDDGHFAPSFPLQLGENTFTLSQGDDTLTLTVTRLSNVPVAPTGVAFAAGSLLPAVDIARQPNELICFSAIAPANARVAVNLAGSQIPLMAPSSAMVLPDNFAVLVGDNAPYAVPDAIQYEGCTQVETPGDLGLPQFQLTLDDQTITQSGSGRITVLPSTPLQVAEVINPAGTARTGPSTSHSRITPLPQGTRAAITGREGDWLRLDYGGWIRASETRIFDSTVPPRSLIRSARSQQVPGWTEVLFPLQVAVPVSLTQTADRLTLTLYNTTAQTDTIYFDTNPIVERMDWRPILPDQAEYTFHFRTDQQWGYKLRYDGTTLVLALRHPPQISPSNPLANTTILLDPGHGGEELGARGPTGYPEKDVNLVVSNLLRDELEARGATVVMTRDTDVAVSLRDRIDQINQVEPTLALSIHYNALPDNGDALNTAGIGAFWYDAQAHGLAEFLHNYLVENLDRPSYGVYWNNLALTRPHVAPTVLLELGFMINPTEFEWITDPDAQNQLVNTLADGIEAWLTLPR